jgi:hypothetical protein
VDIPYVFFQITPSFVYHIVNGKYNIPVEIGLAINKRINEADIFYIPVSDYNYDFRLSSGIDYAFSAAFNLGLNVVFSKALTQYQRKDIIEGEYLPYQIGLELNSKYFFK